jgi:cyclophilin family peptidyl-prolyl cis-trans isomerase
MRPLTARKPGSNTALVLNRRTTWLNRLARRVLADVAGSRAGMIERLEQRQLLAGTPLPVIGDLENASDAVFRFETTFGDIDIELFTSDSRITATTTNFINYITSGRLDETFFHRKENNFVVQGGGFKYDDVAGLSQVQTDTPIVLQAVRSNLARTLSMARTSVDDSGTSQFFINLVDNFSLDAGANGDPSNHGYAVFGKVIQGWSVVQQIQARPSNNLTTDPAFAGSQASNFGNVPTTTSYNAILGVRENALVHVINAEMIKPAGSFGFFVDKIYYPEGFRSASSEETVELTNPNAFATTYQLIAHYENGQRDNVIASGTIAAGTTLELKVWDPTNPTASKVRADTPYALQLETAAAAGAVGTVAPIAAAYNRRDFGGTIGDSFFHTNGYSATNLRTWDFARVERNPNSREFVTWVNTTDQNATVTVNFYTSSGLSSTVKTFALEAYRRGGMNFFAQGMPDGVYAIRVTSTQPIVAAMSDFDLPSAAGATYLPGFGGIGQAGGGATNAVLANAEILNNFTNNLSIFNPGNTPAVVTFNFWRTSRPVGTSPITKIQIVLAQSRADYEMTSVGLDGMPVGEKFTVTYSTAPQIVVTYTSVDNTGRGTAATTLDGVQTSFQIRSGSATYFADGLIDPTRSNATQSEVLSLFNPFADAAVSYSYTVSILFSDGTEIAAAAGTLGANKRLDLAIDQLSSVRNKAASNSAFRHYGIVVTGIATGGTSGTQTVAPFSQLVRRDTVTGRSVTSLGTNSDSGRAYSDPIFLPGSSGSS